MTFESRIGIFFVAAAVATATAVGGAEITIGMSAAFSGPAKSLGREMRLGIESCFHRVNAAGGVNGHTLRLVALDDSYVPLVAAANMDRLISQEGVLAVIGNVGTPTAALTVPIANREQVLLFGALTGAGLLRNEPPDRYVVNYRASYAEETAAMISGLVEIGIRPYEIAFFTQDDSYGDTGYEGAAAALRAAGFDAVNDLPHGRYPRNTLDVGPGLAKILTADLKPRAIIMVGAYVPCAKFIRLARQALPGALFLNVSFVGSRALAAELGAAGEGVVVTQVVPHFASELPLVRDYRRDLGAYAPEASAGFVSLEGYVAARLLVEGLRRTAGVPTRESIIDALETITDLDPGLGIAITFSPTRHQASHRVWPTMIRDGRFVPIAWSDLKPDGGPAAQ